MLTTRLSRSRKNQKYMSISLPKPADPTLGKEDFYIDNAIFDQVRTLLQKAKRQHITLEPNLKFRRNIGKKGQVRKGHDASNVSVQTIRPIGAMPIPSNTLTFNDHFQLHHSILIQYTPDVLESSHNPEQNTENLGKRNKGYVRHEVEADGNCGYTSFGITRESAVQLLLRHIADISNIIKLPVQHALLTEDFHRYLFNNGIVTTSHQTILNNDSLLDRYSTDLAVQNAYIQYDVENKCIDGGYSHPAVLQALAHIQNIEIHMWRLGENNILVPHNTSEGNYAVYAPQGNNERVDILFINNNHFERLELSSYEGNIPENGIYPLETSCSQNLGVYLLCEAKKYEKDVGIGFRYPMRPWRLEKTSHINQVVKYLIYLGSLKHFLNSMLGTPPKNFAKNLTLAVYKRRTAFKKNLLLWWSVKNLTYTSEFASYLGPSLYDISRSPKIELSEKIQMCIAFFQYIASEYEKNSNLAFCDIKPYNFSYDLTNKTCVQCDKKAIDQFTMSTRGYSIEKLNREETLMPSHDLFAMGQTLLNIVRADVRLNLSDIPQKRKTEYNTLINLATEITTQAQSPHRTNTQNSNLEYIKTHILPSLTTILENHTLTSSNEAVNHQAENPSDDQEAGHSTSYLKIQTACAGIALVVGIGACCTGVGALVGVPVIFASMSVLTTGLVIGAGGLSSIGSATALGYQAWSFFGKHNTYESVSITDVLAVQP